MIKPEQIPDEVVKAALEAWKKDTETFHPNAGTIAAAINAWPGFEYRANGAFPAFGYGPEAIVLPLPQEAGE